MNEKEELITVAEAAKRTGMSETGIRSAMTRGQLHYQEFYGRYMLAPSDVATWQASRRQKGRPKGTGKKEEGEPTL